MKKTQRSLTSLLAIAASLLLILAGTVGLVLLQKPLKESQDLRKDASIASGQVAVTGSPRSGDNFSTGNASINLQANTQGVQTDGVQLVFNIVSNTINEVPSVHVPGDSGLYAAYQQIEQTGDGYLVSLIAVPQQIGQTFSANSPTTIAQLNLSLDRAGGIEINFDREKSKSIIHSTNPPEDALTHVDTLVYSVSSNNTDPSPSPSPDSSPDASPGTGGTTINGCNNSCSSSSECEANHRCYEGQCRLVTNISSSSCQPESDQGLSFTCNQYCADSRECDDQYACQNNRCRRADNPDNEFCQAPTATIQGNITSSCNVSCNVNADCAVNLRCYYGSCRLATNPSSTTCAAYTKQTVSSLYAEDTKGIDDDQEATDAAAPAATISAKSTLQPLPSPDTVKLPEEKTALDSLLNSLRNIGIPTNLLPIVAFVAGGLLLLLIIIPKLLGKKRSPSSIPQLKTDPKAAASEQELQAKLDQLKAAATPPAPPAPPTMSKPGMPQYKPGMPQHQPRPTQQQPVTATMKPRPPVTIPPIPTRPVTKPTTNIPLSPPPKIKPQSTMVDRAKEKGIKLPDY
jgi:hypothetical protein